MRVNHCSIIDAPSSLGLRPTGVDGLPDELRGALAVVLSSPGVVGMDVTIYNPALDDADRSGARTLAGVVTSAFTTAQQADTMSQREA